MSDTDIQAPPQTAAETESRNWAGLIAGLLVICLLFVVTLIAAGCGDDGSGQLTEDEFFNAVDVLDDEYAMATDDLEAEVEQAMEGATSEGARVEAFVSFAQDGAVVLENFIDGIAELNAPDELTDFQDRAVSVGRAAIESLNEVGGALSDVSTDDELQAVLATAGTQEPFDRLNAICFEAQALADDAGVDVDYDCD